MANERTYPCLPCGNLDESISFYQVLGFKTTYRQTRPNPYAVVGLEDIVIHLFGIEGFNPAESYGTVIVAVPDPEPVFDGQAPVTDGSVDRTDEVPVGGYGGRDLGPNLDDYEQVEGESDVDAGSLTER